MSAFKKPIVALVGVLAALVAGLFFATSSAGAYPSGVNPVLTINPSNPSCGDTVTYSGTHFQPGEPVTISDGVGDSVTVNADGKGNVSGSLELTCPNGTEPTTITATGRTSGGVDAVTISSGGSNSGGGSSSGSGGLSNTGVAVIGIGALGVVLLAGGGLLLLAGRRRTNSAA
ncbi:hypothetical protein [uncultured Jatrophihabitans sp.]|uniref:hypothetical protein n=1 Tax=uncultured Jatrophihabitans sp. TaxID=1610747 RepID=UPI0035C98D2E